MMRYFLPLVFLAIHGCTWVSLSPEAEAVQIIADSAVADQCQNSGRTFVSARIEAGGFIQKPERLNEQLENLARNDAAEAGGNALFMAEEITDGNNRVRTYNILKC